MPIDSRHFNASRATLIVALNLSLISLLRAQDSPVGRRPQPEDLAPLASQSVAKFSPPSPLSYTIDKKTPTFSFDTGTSPIILVQLPDFTAPYIMRLSSECKCLGFTKRVFIPDVTFVDKEYHPTRTLGEEAFPVKQAGKRPLRVEADIPVSEANRGDRFLVIHTDATKVGQQAGKLSSNNGTFQIYNYPFFRGIEGKVRLEIVPEKKAKN